jgi:hypothetical protein
VRLTTPKSLYAARALVRCRAGRVALPAVGAVVETCAVSRAARMRAF